MLTSISSRWRCIHSLKINTIVRLATDPYIIYAWSYCPT
jgi:hypothetical protein